MNKKRREKLFILQNKISVVKKDISELIDELKNILVEEENAFDSMPEGLQCSERGMNSEESIELMYDIKTKLEESIENIDDILNM